MNNEIERKFVLAEMPDFHLLDQATLIRQGYVKIIDGLGEVRLRHDARLKKFFVTSKKGTGLVREESEVEIDEIMFKALWPATAGRRLTKWRFSFSGDESVLSLDVYCDNLAGLFILEREFDSIEEARSFELPAWVRGVREVTGQKSFSNFCLAH